MYTSNDYSYANFRFNFGLDTGCYENMIARIKENYPDVTVIRPAKDTDWFKMGIAHKNMQKGKPTKNDRTNCFSEVLVVVLKDGKMFRRRASRWVCGSVGGLVGRRSGQLSTSIEREYWSLIFTRRWLSAIATVIFTDTDVIEGCFADITLKIHGFDDERRLGIQVSQLTFECAGQFMTLGHSVDEVIQYLELGVPFVIPILTPNTNTDPDADPYEDCGYYLLLPDDLEEVKRFEKVKAIHLNPFAFLDNSIGDNSWNQQLKNHLFLWKNLKTGEFSEVQRENGMTHIQALVLNHIMSGNPQLRTDDQWIDMAPFYKKREQRYLKWFSSLLSTNQHIERRVWRQGDLVVLLPSLEVCVMEFKSFTDGLTQFSMRHNGGQPYNPNTVDILAVARMNDMEVVECVLYPLRTADRQYNLVDRMARTVGIKDTVIPGMRYPNDRLVISNGQPFDINNFNEKLQSWVEREPVVWELTDEEKNVIKAEKATLNQAAIVVEDDLMNDFYDDN